MPPRKKKPAAKSTGLTVADMTSGTPPPAVAELAQHIVDDGGVALARYRDPWGGAWVIVAALPIDKLEPTPFQRELSKTHADRLAGVIPKVGRFLDPVIAIRKDGMYWTPNGMHRLSAMKALGAQAMTALVLPDEEVAFRILALNTEKAHNLKDRALEVIRMLRALTEQQPKAKEEDFAFEFEEPAFATLGLCYEERPRFSGGAYLPVLKRTEEFSKSAVGKALEERKERAAKVLELDDAVNEAVDRLKAAGLKSAYLKPFVVARCNPLRFVKAAKVGEKAPRASFDGTLDKMIGSAKKLDASKVRPQDLASMAGGPPPEE